MNCKIKQSSQTKSQNEVQQIVDSVIHSALKDTTLKAVSVGLYFQQEEFSFHYGKGPNGRPVDDRSLYKIGSVSKTILGTLVAKAVNEKKCKIEEGVGEYLDDSFQNLSNGDGSITLKHLLTHTSGLPRNMPTSIDSLYSQLDKTLPSRINEIQKHYSKKDFLQDLSSIELESLPGTNYNYSNAGAELLANIMERIYAKPYSQLIEELLREEFDMPNTKINYSTSQETLFVKGYGMDNILAPNSISFLWNAAGAMRSTLPDLINYMKLQLDTGNPIIDRSHQELFTISDDDKIAYLWPINSDQVDGKYYGMHGGSYGTQIWLFAIPKHNIGITVVANQSTMETSGKLLSIINAVLDKIR